MKTKLRPQDAKAAAIRFGIELETKIPLASCVDVGGYHNGRPVQGGIDLTGTRVAAPKFMGAAWRTPDSPYKCGRSTENEGFLLKIKRFEDSEAVVLDCIEGMSNTLVMPLLSRHWNRLSGRFALRVFRQRWRDGRVHEQPSSELPS